MPRKELLLAFNDYVTTVENVASCVLPKDINSLIFSYVTDDLICVIVKKMQEQTCWTKKEAVDWRNQWYIQYGWGPPEKILLRTKFVLASLASTFSLDQIGDEMKFLELMLEQKLGDWIYCVSGVEDDIGRSRSHWVANEIEEMFISVLNTSTAFFKKKYGLLPVINK